MRARFALWCGCMVLTLAWLIQPVSGAEGSVSEEDGKAAVIAKIGDYVKKWPGGTFADAQAPFVIGVMGRNLFEKELEEAVKYTNENGTGRKLIVRKFKEGELVENCQLLFIATSEKHRVAQILQNLEGKGILTVSDLDGFVTRHGGCLGLVVEGKAFRFDVNLSALDQEKIQFTSLFLGLKRNRLIRDGKVVK